MRRQGAAPWPRLLAAVLAVVLAFAAASLSAVALAAASRPALAAPPRGASAASAPAVAPRVLRVYVRDGCPHCEAAKAFVPALVQQRPGLDVLLRPVDEDPAARDELVALASAAGVWPPGVPTFEIEGRLLVGFDDSDGGRRELLALVDGAAEPPAEVRTTLFGTLSASRLGLPLFTLALGLLDGFNPCAMWVLLFLLSVLVRLRDRRRIALVAGTFVLASGAVYYAFMAAWLNLFLAVGLSDAVRVGLALLALAIGAINLKDFVVFGTGPSLGIPAGARPGLVARMHGVLQARALPAMLLGVTALAVVVNFVELLCTAGLPAVYTAVLAQQQLSALAHYGFLGLYIVGYIADDALMVGLAVVALGRGRLGERGGRWLKGLSGLVMVVLGAVLLWRPQWLT